MAAPEAKALIDAHGGPAVAGGPATKVMPDYLGCEIRESTPWPVLAAHNPFATFTTRGCPNRCSFCIVPKAEGDFRELASWDPRPILCDNNLTAASHAHFERVVESVLPFGWADFNQGLDARLLRPWHVDGIRRIAHPVVRFAWDHADMEGPVMDAIATVRRAGIYQHMIRVYVLVGNEESPEEAIYRLEAIRPVADPVPMRYQPLWSLERNSYVPPQWDPELLRHVVKYYSRLKLWGSIALPDWIDMQGPRANPCAMIR